MSRLKINYLYNLLYQILIMILPFLTAPYLARIIGPKGVGTCSYSYSIASYFVMIIILGLNNYGNRSIAEVRENKKELSKTFCSIFAMQCIFGIMVIIIYLIYITSLDHSIIMKVQSIYIISAFFDINWFFFGMEKFKLTVVKNALIKVGSVAAIFLLIKEPSDYVIYACIIAASALLSQLVLWPSLFKYIHWERFTLNDVIKHIKPNLILFIPIVATSLYKSMDKVVLGAMTNMANVGYYENAERIVILPLGCITSLGTVMLPKITNMAAKGNHKQNRIYFYKSMKFSMIASFAMAFGIIAISDRFIPLFFGKAFNDTIILTKLLAPTIIFVSCGNVVRQQFLIPYKKDIVYIKSVSSGAITNLILNICLIPCLGIAGVAVATLIAELLVPLYQLLKIRNIISIRKIMSYIFESLFAGSCMLALLFTFNHYVILSPIIHVGLTVILGCASYLIIIFILEKNIFKSEFI